MAPDAGAPGLHDAPSNLQQVLHFYAELRLPELQQQLDAEGMVIAKQQEDATLSRRKLADETRAFKRSAPEASLVGVGPLLKQYQEEVDRLTRRAKHGENAFLQLYQRLYEAPDPSPCLAAAFETASRVAELEVENRKLATSLHEYQTESTVIKNQDGTIRKLEEKVRGLEAALEERGLEIEDVRRQAVAEADVARAAQAQEREAQLTQALLEARGSLSAMQRLHTASQNQLFAMQSQSEEAQVGRQHELELATAELERAQERLVALEREKQQLVSAAQEPPPAQGKQPETAVAGAPGGGQADSGSASVEATLRQELHTQRELAARLRLEVASLRQELEQSGSMWEARTEGLRSTIQAAEQHARAVEEQLSMRPTNKQVEELRQQVRILHAVSYNAMSEDGPDEHPGSGPAAQQPGMGSLEALLLQKNRHIEHELTMARLKLVDVRGELEASTSHAADLEAQLADKQALIVRLEDDLLASRTGHGSAGSSSGAGGGGGGGSSSRQGGGLLGDDEASGAGQEEESSMIQVVCSQRDRFRARKLELEGEVSRLKVELSSARTEAASTRADNVALIERLRYVHGFKQRKNAGDDVESGADAERRYGRIYEEGINPFAEFQDKQRERQRSNLHLPDRMMFRFGQLVFGSQGARLYTFFYLVGLHLLVMVLLSRMTHTGSSDLYQHQLNVLNSKHDVSGLLHHAQPAATRASPHHL